MFKPVSSKIDFPELEKGILSFWQEEGIFARSLALRKDAPPFVFYEGPPTANGSPGIHHVLARVFKDVIPRYRTMKGYYVARKAGWDCHGLPVEIEVEKELGFTHKSQIEEYGVARFNSLCRESVFRYVREWETMTDRIAFWVNLEDAYITCSNEYMESCWDLIHFLWDRGLIYQDYKVTPHCPRCGTSLSSHEVALGYKDDTPDPSVYILFRLQKDIQKGESKGAEKLGWDHQKNEWRGRRPSLLVWTTTPWTLTGNVAAAVAPDKDYVMVDVQGPYGLERVIVAEPLAKRLLGEMISPIVTLQGRELVGLYYDPPYEFSSPGWIYHHQVIQGDFVSMEEGTGIVHIAPAFGEVDLEMGRANNLPLLQTVDLRGTLTLDAKLIVAWGHSAEGRPWLDERDVSTPDLKPWAGRFVKDADPDIIKDLQNRKLLFRSERILHTYPFCWRCDSPLLYYAKTSWYIKTKAVKDQLIAANEEINWYPEHIKHGRFGDWLANNVDWALSRERYWGTPLPIWRCDDCGQPHCIGSVQELRELSGFPKASDFDLHRPYIDEVVFPCTKGCRGIMRRVPEVLDCWFDSGAMPVAQWHYPYADEFKNEVDPSAKLRQKGFPADFICEAVDQTRGWFYSLHALSVLRFNELSFKNVICLGLVLDAQGEKMSKSRGNVVDPWTVLDTYGADALRWYLFTASPPGNPRRFSLELVGEAARKFLLTLWNTYSFFVTYANIDQWKPTASQRSLFVTYANIDQWKPTASQRSLLDRWILSELNQLISLVDESLGEYDPTTAGRAIQSFVEDLSNWYVRRSRRRFWKSENDEDKKAAYATLYECLVTLSRLLAPFTPYVAEEMYQNLERAVDGTAQESVHLTDFPQAETSVIDPPLMEDMAMVMRIASLGRAARSKAGLKIRQPIGRVLVKTKTSEEQEGLQRHLVLLLEELNARTLAPVKEEEALVQYAVRPNLSLLGPKYGKRLPRIVEALRQTKTSEIVASWQKNKDIRLQEFSLTPEELLIETLPQAGYAVVQEGEYLVGIATRLTPELVDEGLARELVHRLQTMRKEAGFEIADHIITYYQASSDIERVLQKHQAYIQQETLSDHLVAEAPPDGAHRQDHYIDGEKATLGVKKVL